ncbi:MAG: T9SS type A sorting domain-containing protein [Candidatus Hatepunaea meridiana]|nr:T9SS type A sorting domain-containing protein [Candidatus Hatepunaea meridiana]
MKITKSSKIVFICLFITILTVQIQSRPLTYQDIPVTRNLLNTPMPTRLEYLTKFPQYELFLHSIQRWQNQRDEDGTVVVAVNHVLLEALGEEFDLFAGDIADEGYEVVMLDMEGGSPAEVKDLVIEEGGNNITGVILAGEIALAWFEQYEHFNDENEPDSPNLAEYPIDLFYMDIDGVWQDTSGNGIYDVHSGNWEPDIWFARLPGYNLSQIDEHTLIEDYLEKVHSYRTGELTLPHKALNFIDDDWMPWADQWGENVSLIYGLVQTVLDAEETSASNYHRELDEEQHELIQVAVHSGPDTHYFRVDNHSRYDYFRFRNLRDDANPIASFYNLYACSNMNLGRNLCMGALYALGGPYGLGAVGSAKTGAMLYFEDYYQPLADDDCFGDAFKQWFIVHGRQEGRENWARSWFYGMTYFGDPTLKLPKGLRINELVVTSDEENGDNDNFADAGETIELMVVIGNLSEAVIEDIDVTLLTEDPYIEFIEDEAHLNEVSPDRLSPLEGFSLSIASDCPNQHQTEIIVQMTPNDAEAWYTKVVLEIGSPVIQLASYSFFEVDGNSDSWVNPGETGDLFLLLQNTGWDDLPENCRIDVTTSDDMVEIADDDIRLSGIEPDGSVRSPAIRCTISGDAAESNPILLQAMIMDGELERGNGYILLPLSADMNLIDDFDTEPEWFNSHSVTEGYANVWRWSEDAGADGSGGIAFGAPDSGLYPAHCDGALELPLMMFEGNAVLEIHHRFSAEERFDGGIVEINRGQSWETLEPVGGYNGDARNNGSFPGGGCWNGIFDWGDDRFMLGRERGSVRIRLRFVSDYGLEMEGWFIDAIRLTGAAYPVTETPQKLVSTDYAIQRVYPNPFNSSFTVEYSLPQPENVTINLYDSQGRKAAELTKGFHKSGKHSISFNNTDLPTGIYVIRMNAGKYCSYEKVLLLK